MKLFKKKKPEPTFPYDHRFHMPIIRCSICTGEQTAGFRDNRNQEGNNSDRPYELRLGMHEGSVYCDLEETSEILKISEGAKVDRISVAIPES